jgi:phage recombination protein Bet
MAHSTALAQPARAQFTKEQVQMLRRTVAKDCNDDEFVYFLEVAAMYDLNPLVHEVYAAKQAGNNGSGGRVMILIGRNGWLKMARRYPDFKGIDGDIVRENDIFRVKRTPEGREIIHEYEGSIEKRGAIVGAWAEVLREGQKPYYFFAPMSEYRPKSEGKLKFSPWGSQESVMIQKCAYVGALRIAFNISGVYDEAELANTSVGADAPAEVEVEWGENAEELQALVAQANALRPGTYRNAKLAMLLNGKSAEQRDDVIAQIRRFVAENTPSTEPEPPEAEVVE